MTKISISLIRKHNNAKDVDELLELGIIYLNGLNILEIDDLDVFTNLKELYLSSNSIKAIENIEYLQNLYKLDLSYNEIDSFNLLNGLKICPKSLKILDISGNPCCQDVEAMKKAQDEYKNIDFIVNNVTPKEEKKANDSGGIAFGVVESHERNDIRDNETSSVEYLPSRGVCGLDPDVILREIVERKCKRQDMLPKFRFKSDLEATENKDTISRSNSNISVGSVGSIRKLTSNSKLNISEFSKKSDADAKDDVLPTFENEEVVQDVMSLTNDIENMLNQSVLKFGARREERLKQMECEFEAKYHFRSSRNNSTTVSGAMNDTPHVDANVDIRDGVIPHMLKDEKHVMPEVVPSPSNMSFDCNRSNCNSNLDNHVSDLISKLRRRADALRSELRIDIHPDEVNKE